MSSARPTTSGPKWNTTNRSARKSSCAWRLRPAENLSAHYLLSLVYTQLGDEARAAEHRREHEKYLPDYNAQDRAIAIARRANPAADHAAQATVIYPLQRQRAPELGLVP